MNRRWNVSAITGGIAMAALVGTISTGSVWSSTPTPDAAAAAVGLPVVSGPAPTTATAAPVSRDSYSVTAAPAPTAPAPTATAVAATAAPSNGSGSVASTAPTCATGEERAPAGDGYVCGPADLADPAGSAAKSAAAPVPSPSPVPVASPSPIGSPWRLVWGDEFDGTAVDTSKWSVLNNSTYGDGNNELACLMAKNVTVASGYLTIRAERLSTPQLCGSRDSRFPGGRSYTSGFVETKGKTAFQYGRFEVRFKAPTGAGTSKGLWPAFWMRPTDGGLGELDAFEIIGTNASETADANKLVQTLWYDYQGTYPKQAKGYRLPSGTYDSAFHTAAVEWEPGSIRWYIDDTLTYERTLATTPWLDEAYSRPFYLKLNMAVGGNWPGSPEATTQFPADYVIDYVRVYQH